MQARKVLLVDDSPLVVAIVVHTLTGAGLEVASVDDPTKLADAIGRERPDVVVLDGTFPGVDEDRLVELAAPHATDWPILMFSDRAPEEVASLVTRIGARLGVSKDAAKLLEAIEAFLRREEGG